jgi:HK97 family phage portal protein
VLSEDIAKLPLIVYAGRPKRQGTREGLLAHDALDQPNPWQTGFEFREMQQAHLELNGNFYAIKTMVRGEVRELLPIPPTRMKVELEKDWTLKYTLTFDDGTQKSFRERRCTTSAGLSLNGFTGISPIEYQRETIGFGRASQVRQPHVQERRERRRRP